MHIDDWFKLNFPLFLTRLLRKVPNTHGRFCSLLLRFNGQVTLMHAHIFTYIHTKATYIPTNVLTHIHTYIHTYIHACMRAYVIKIYAL